MSNNERVPEQYLSKLRNIFKKYYFETSEILIASEQFSSHTNQDVFYYLSGILDEIFFLTKIKNNDIMNDGLEKIITMFIGIQDHVLLPAIYIMKKEFEDIQLYDIESKNILFTLEKKLKDIAFSKKEKIVISPPTTKIDFPRLIV